MKISKYLLLSTTILGLMNPLVALADEQSNIGSNSSSQSSSESINKNNHKSTQKNIQQNNNNVDAQTNKATSETEDATVNGLPYSYDATTKTVTYHAGTYTANGGADVVNNGLLEDIQNAEHVKFDGKVKIIANNNDTIELFTNSTKATVIEGMNNIDTSNLTNFNYLFAETSYESLDLSNFDSSQVVSFWGTFYHMRNLKSLDVSHLDTANGKHFDRMFSGMGNIKELDVSNFNTSNGVSFTYMFAMTPYISNLDVSNFDMANAKTVTSMFSYDASLKTVKTGAWDLSHVNALNSMFRKDTSLTSVDIENWTTGQLIGVRNMFNGASSIKKLDISKIDMTNNEMLTLDHENIESDTYTQGLTGMLADMSQLEELKIGPKNNLNSVGWGEKSTMLVCLKRVNKISMGINIMGIGVTLVQDPPIPPLVKIHGHQLI
ncbi:BspA family leucine-rich repeat surface protein [Weissella coleopterorum]|uniref:BspA family leucine-rich repeat surface protein n=1 Tax=Weissella coleopterorum TaxID=2714949 RepID=A0A6G8B1G1_9LACO|nr:BspA family leucine-rich repeat surface protein [Weissella coleopterorum]QIL51055.1 BspA family leucine-rich repeat surface protein [Weissella coleopterorum]